MARSVAAGWWCVGGLLKESVLFRIFAGCGVELRTHFSGGHAFVAGLVTLNFVEQFTEAHAGFVQLGLRNTYGAAQYFGNFVVLVALNIMQNKYRAVAQGQLLDAAFEIYAVKRSLEQQVGRAHE